MHDLSAKFDRAWVVVATKSPTGFATREYALFTFTAIGEIYIKGINTRCEIRGSAKPVSTKNVYTSNVTFGANCGDLTGTVLDGVLTGKRSASGAVSILGVSGKPEDNVNVIFIGGTI